MGAGIAGLTLAGRLADRGGEVTVVERAPGPREQGYMIDFFGPGFEAAEAIGVLPRLRELGYRIERFGYVDERGRTRASLDYRRFQRVAEGRLFSIMRPDLERGLREYAAGRVDLRYATTVAGFDNRADGVTVSLSDGDSIEADLLVGADGIRSATRAAVLGPEESFVRHLGMHTAAWVFADAGAHERVRDGFYLTDTIGAHMGFYALREGMVAAFAVHRSDPPLPVDPRATVRETYAGLGWLAPTALRHLPQEPGALYYDQVAQILLPRWFTGRVVLIGDAAHAVSLVAGQGASLGIAGAYVLARRLEEEPSVDAALAAYQARWHPVATERARIGRRGAEWILPSSPLRLLMRRWALKAMRLPGLDKRLAAGLLGKDRTPVTATAG
ncbi:FAD-dependent oxidoreductase [Actinorhabdospora filicis]|uniref:FAD-dependent oxidoreductase n=1 Tax=Actinorhabdospora filicis TaxID=1785913 RepID=A0A9W6W7Z8_9ACTN|nr:FAD-dependent oxidoreductase [Actinorhabdospora filicis]